MMGSCLVETREAYVRFSNIFYIFNLYFFPLDLMQLREIVVSQRVNIFGK